MSEQWVAAGGRGKRASSNAQFPLYCPCQISHLPTLPPNTILFSNPEFTQTEIKTEIMLNLALISRG